MKQRRFIHSVLIKMYKKTKCETFIWLTLKVFFVPYPKIILRDNSLRIVRRDLYIFFLLKIKIFS